MPVTLEQVGKRLYLVDLPFAAKDRAKDALGMNGKNFDPDRRQWWVGAAKKADAEKLVAALNDPTAPVPKEDPDKVTLVGKGKLKGRTVYVRCFSGDGTRARVVTFPAADGTFLDYWSDVGGPDGVEVVKRYEAREEKGAYGRPTGRTIRQTLGGIVKFVERAKADETAVKCGTADTKQCWECGRAFTEFQARTNGGDWNGGDWNDGYCGC